MTQVAMAISDANLAFPISAALVAESYAGRCGWGWNQSLQEGRGWIIYPLDDPILEVTELNPTGINVAGTSIASSPLTPSHIFIYNT